MKSDLEHQKRFIYHLESEYNSGQIITDASENEFTVFRRNQISRESGQEVLSPIIVNFL